MDRLQAYSALALEKYASLQQQGSYREVLIKAMNEAHVWRVAVSPWEHALLTAQPDERDRITQLMEAKGDLSGAFGNGLRKRRGRATSCLGAERLVRQPSHERFMGCKCFCARACNWRWVALEIWRAGRARSRRLLGARRYEKGTSEDACARGGNPELPTQASCVDGPE